MSDNGNVNHPYGMPLLLIVFNKWRELLGRCRQLEMQRFILHTKTTKTQTLVPASMINISCMYCITCCVTNRYKMNKL